MRWSRAFPGVAVFLAAAVIAGPVRSQETSGQTPRGGSETTSLGTPTDISVDESKHERPAFPSLRDFGSFGPSVGFMKVFGGDLGSKARARPVMQGVFRYRFSDKWIGIGEFGYGWNAFKDRGDTVLTFTFGTLGAARQIAVRWGTEFRAMGGAGFYRWDYKYQGVPLRDRFPVGQEGGQTVYGGSQAFYKGIAPGGYLGLEGERRITRNVTVTGTLQQHYLFTSDSKFQQVFNRNYSFLSFRIGANYHFSPTQGILWERKQSRTIHLESGKEGK